MDHVLQILLGMLVFTAAAGLLGGVSTRIRRFVLSLASIATGGGLYLHVGGYAAVSSLISFAVLACVFWLICRFVPRKYIYPCVVILPILLLVPLKRSNFVELLGLSYTIFRLCSLGMEMIQKKVGKIAFFDFMGFLFNPLTFFVGPINSYSRHLQWLDGSAERVRYDDCFLRMSKGFFKVLLLGPALYQITYPYLLPMGSRIEPLSLPICTLLFLFYIYINFSGFNDISIALGAMIGMPILENFSRPFSQTNPAEFWRHWHMTLSHLARDIVFAPLSMFMARRFPRVPLQLVLGISIIISFLLIGLWHGSSMWMLLFGFYNGVGVLLATILKDRWPSWFRIFAASWFGRPLLCVCTTFYIAVGATTLGLSPQAVERLIGAMSH
jgi:D-alanyl-lipoteichoic acid acyltransferase DltB (MBOAT superfamily)